MIEAVNNAPRNNVAWYLIDRWVDEGLGESVALRFEGSDSTYHDLQRVTSRIGQALLGIGMREEERVMLVMADSVQMITGILGTMRVGGVAVPVSTMLTGPDLAKLLADSHARIVMCSGEFAEKVAEACRDADVVTHVVISSDEIPSFPKQVSVLGWSDFLTSVPDSIVDPLTVHSDSSALWLYTSGTTGEPKAVMHRHANIRHVCETYGRSILRIRNSDRCFSVAKLFFAYGIGNSLFFPLSVGACSILESRRPTPAIVAERIEQDRPTIFFAVPAFFSAMVANDLSENLLIGVRIAISAGEALPASLQQRWTERFGVDILDGLGSTEALHIFISNSEGDIGPGTSGKPVPGYEVEIRTDDGSIAPMGTPGQLFVRGQSTAIGYFHRTDATRSTFQGEWLATGDTYVQDAQGRFTCLGRSSDMIKSGGIWVSPSEVEARLLEHPDVQEAAVVAGFDADELERPVACVVLREGAVTNENQLIDHCRDGLAHFKAPRAVVLVPALPRTSTGKLQRFQVRELVAQVNPLSSLA
jgi:benzoate-CoA ligase family protein